jgi:hypothetical protein
MIFMLPLPIIWALASLAQYMKLLAAFGAH